MPNVRRLAYRDRFVWSLIQEMVGGSGTLPPLQFEPGAETPVLVSWTQEQWERVFSALMTGADLTYPEQSHQVVWDLLQFVEYPIPFESPPTMLQIDVFCCNSELLSGAGTLNYFSVAGLPFGYMIYNDNVAFYGIENFIYLNAGEYDYDGWASYTVDGGNTTVAIVDGTGTIDTIISSVSQLGSLGTRIHHTGSFTIPESGLYRIVVANNGTGSGSNRRMNWTSHHIRQVP